MFNLELLGSVPKIFYTESREVILYRYFQVFFHEEYSYFEYEAHCLEMHRSHPKHMVQFVLRPL